MPHLGRLIHRFVIRPATLFVTRALDARRNPQRPPMLAVAFPCDEGRTHYSTDVTYAAMIALAEGRPILPLVTVSPLHWHRETYAVPAPGEPLFQAAFANFNPWTEAKVDHENVERGPMLIVSGEKDHTVPTAISKAAYKKQKKNEGVTEFVEIPGRGHALTIDSGWREVADTALKFVKRFVS